MKAGYARVSTKDQTVDLQVDALKRAGCTKVYTEVMNGSRAERPILSKVLEHLRAGRNEPCPCGSGKKYKHCCGQAAQ